MCHENEQKHNPNAGFEPRRKCSDSQEVSMSFVSNIRAIFNNQLNCSTYKIGGEFLIP